MGQPMVVGSILLDDIYLIPASALQKAGVMCRVYKKVLRCQSERVAHQM